MIDFCRGLYSWSKLIRLVEWLPADSAFHRAVANDPDYTPPATDDGPKAPSILAWDRTREQTATLFDALESIRVAVLAPHMPKGRKAKPRQYPRPITEATKAEHRRERDKHRALSAKMLPHLVEVS